MLGFVAVAGFLSDVELCCGSGASCLMLGFVAVAGRSPLAACNRGSEVGRRCLLLLGAASVVGLLSGSSAGHPQKLCFERAGGRAWRGVAEALNFERSSP